MNNDTNIWKSIFSDFMEMEFPMQKKETVKDWLMPKRIIFNNKTTICFWPDGTKTKVTCAEDETFIPEVGVAYCMVKKVFGSRSRFLKTVDKAYYQPPKK